MRYEVFAPSQQLPVASSAVTRATTRRKALHQHITCPAVTRLKLTYTCVSLAAHRGASAHAGQSFGNRGRTVHIRELGFSPKTCDKKPKMTITRTGIAR